MRGDLLLTAAELTSETGVSIGDRVVVGVSGGADSLTLLLTLSELGIDVVAAHFDHRIRAESAADAEWTRAFCTARGIPIAVESADVPAAARAAGGSLEDTARKLRYRFLFSLAERESAVAVAVGHHADDQAETIVAHLLRGSGLDGLSGMSGRTLANDWSLSAPLIRPLLKIRRREIETWLAARGIAPLVDRTNADTRFARNRIRRELIPYLEASFNPNLIDTLTRGAAAIRADRDYLADAAEKAFRRCLIGAPPNLIRLDRERFRAEPRAIQSRIVRLMADRLGGLRGGITHALILRALDFFAEADEASRPLLRVADWCEGRYLFAIGGEMGMKIGSVRPDLFYARFYPLLTEAASFDSELIFTLSAPKAVRTGNGRIGISSVPVSGADSFAAAVAEMKRDRFCVYLDAGRVHGALTVRPRRKKERFVPFGMKGKSLRIEDFFLNEKVPADIRGRYPLLCDEAGALWVVGLRTAERAALTESTARALRLSWTMTLNENETLSDA